MARASTAVQNETLPFLSSQERLQAYQLFVDGCSHLWSKNKLQAEKVLNVFKTLLPLTKSDPYFLAHLASYVFKQKESKDLQVLTAYAASLSSADGSPFSPGSKYMKPNLRYVGWAAVHQLDPKLAERVIQLGEIKYSIPDLLNEARHFPISLRTALTKYLLYREKNPEIIAGIKRAGLGGVLKKMYTKLHLHPSNEVAQVLRWQQKDHKVVLEKVESKFKDKTDLEIAETIRREKLPYFNILGELSRISKKMSPVVAVAMLEQATGDQALISYGTYADAGILTDPEVKKLYEDKIRTAKSALDRVDHIKRIAEDDEAKAMLTQARAESRQAKTVGMGKVFVHLDFSGSMSDVKEFAEDRGTILAECVNDPLNNFGWGWFSGMGTRLPLPQEFVKDAFRAVLFGVRGGGSTNCFALYPEARDFGADVDVFISDQEHTDGDLSRKIHDYHITHPDITKPRACVVVSFRGEGKGPLAEAYEENNIPVSIIKPSTLTESALVVEAVKAALLGPVVIVEEIMATDLLELPAYYLSLNNHEAVPD